MAEDYESHIVAKADPWALLAVALDKLNGTTIDKLVKEAEKIAEARVLAVKEATQAAMKEIKGNTITPCKGKVRAHLVAIPQGQPTVSSTTAPRRKPSTVLVVKNTRKPRRNGTKDNPNQVSLPLG